MVFIIYVSKLPNPAILWRTTYNNTIKFLFSHVRSHLRTVSSFPIPPSRSYCPRTTVPAELGGRLQPASLFGLAGSISMNRGQQTMLSFLQFPFCWPAHSRNDVRQKCGWRK
jgi:hypothetical protein